jgi:hypothetical protein
MKNGLEQTPNILRANPKDGMPLTGSINFCQRASTSYEQMLEECGGDPRIVAGRRALNKSGWRAQRGYQEAWDSRRPG